MGSVSLTDDKSYIGTDVALVGDIQKNKQSFSAVIKIKNGRIHIRFWDIGLKGEDQNHYDWIIEEGKSRVVHYNGWSNEIICDNTECIVNKENDVQINANNSIFEITLNGNIIHRKALAEIPHITAVCTVDTKMSEIITKLVNFSENEITVNICTDTKMCNSAVITTLTGDSYYAKNTFDDKKAVYPYAETINADTNYNIVIKPRSVNVIRQRFAD